MLRSAAEILKELSNSGLLSLNQILRLMWSLNAKWQVKSGHILNLSRTDYHSDIIVPRGVENRVAISKPVIACY